MNKSHKWNLGVKVSFWGIVIGLATSLVLWLLPPPNRPRLYALRVQVVDPRGNPVDESKIRVSAGNEPHLLPDGWWQVEIPEVKLPTDRRITIWAEHPDWLPSRKQIVLGANPNPQIELRLQAPKSVLEGTVLDRGSRGIMGARVSVLEPSTAVVQTDQDGRFNITLPLTPDKKVTVHVVPRSGESHDAFCYVGASCQIYLE